MSIKSINELKRACSECETLFDILSLYTGCHIMADIMDDLITYETLWAMSEQNDIDEYSMSEWIKSHLDNSVECRVFHERGPAGGWPVVEIKCLDMVFYIDWVLG